MSEENSEGDKPKKELSRKSKIILVVTLVSFVLVLAWQLLFVRLFVCQTVIHLFSTNKMCFDINTPILRVDWDKVREAKERKQKQ